MSRFLRLTNYLINVNQIRKIEIKPNEYKIHLMPDKFSGMLLAGSGSFTYSSEFYTVSEKEHILDYKIVTDWILCEKNNNVWH